MFVSGLFVVETLFVLFVQRFIYMASLYFVTSNVRRWMFRLNFLITSGENKMCFVNEKCFQSLNLKMYRLPAENKCQSASVCVFILSLLEEICYISLLEHQTLRNTNKQTRWSLLKIQYVFNLKQFGHHQPSFPNFTASTCIHKGLQTAGGAAAADPTNKNTNKNHKQLCFVLRSECVCEAAVTLHTS